MDNEKEFGHSIIESEIDIKEEEEGTFQNPGVHGSDNSDIEVLAVCKGTTLGKRNKLLRPLYRKRTKMSVNSVNNFGTGNKESFIKEEIIISSDESDLSDANDDKSNLHPVSNGHKNAKEQKHNNDLSAIILNCPRCNRTDKVEVVTIKSNCKDCNVSMYYVCNKCNLKYDSMPALYRHKKLQCQYVIHKQKKKLRVPAMSLLKCTKCAFVKKMFNTQKNPLPCSKCHHIMCYECVVCSKLYTSYSGMYTHIRRNCQSRRRDYYCNDCNYSASKQMSITRHLMSNHPEHFNPHIYCAKCKKFFENSTQIDRHANLCGLPSYKCAFCLYKPKSYANIEKHLYTDHAKEVEAKGLDYVLSCIANSSQPKDKKPNSTLVSENNAKKKLDFIGLNNLHCPKCNKTEPFQQNELNSSSCPTCKTSFLYQCSLCQKNFLTSVALHRHMRRIHTDPKFHCKNNCGKRYGMVGDMNEHLKICIKEPYKCKFCEFKTRYRQSLSSHIYKLHNKNRRVFECGVCGIVYKTNRAMKKHVKTNCGLLD